MTTNRSTLCVRKCLETLQEIDMSLFLEAYSHTYDDHWLTSLFLIAWETEYHVVFLTLLGWDFSIIGREQTAYLIFLVIKRKHHDSLRVLLAGNITGVEPCD